MEQPCFSMFFSGNVLSLLFSSMKVTAPSKGHTIILVWHWKKLSCERIKKSKAMLNVWTLKTPKWNARSNEELFIDLTLSIYIYPFRVYSRNWPMRVKWTPFFSFRGPFFKKWGPPKGIWYLKRYGKGILVFNLLVQTVPWENERLLTLCRHFGRFWAFVWWNNGSNEEEKGNWDSKRL